jgi:hypothetical protein
MTDTTNTSPEAVEQLRKRVMQFKTMSLPGQPMSMHMGTSYLVGDLDKAIAALSAALEAERVCLINARSKLRLREKQSENYKARAEAAEAERDALKEQGEREGASAVDLMIRHMNRWKAAEAKLKEAVQLLRYMVNHAEWREENEGVFWEATEQSRAFLASIGDKT